MKKERRKVDIEKKTSILHTNIYRERKWNIKAEDEEGRDK